MWGESRLSRPAPGRSLGMTVTQLEPPLRAAIKTLAISKGTKKNDELFSHIFNCTVYGPGSVSEPQELRITWFIVTVALIHAFAIKEKHIKTFSSALEWFFCDYELATRTLEVFPEETIKLAEKQLSCLVVDRELYDLLPYVLEPHGHITRSNFETSHKAKQTRSIKRDNGVYYTPSDVAEFMVQSLAEISECRGSWIDPACGTGIFLRAVIEYHRTLQLHNSSAINLRDFALSNVFGIDKSALATDLAAFIVLIECSKSAEVMGPYFKLWQCIKKNVVCMDALRLYQQERDFSLHCDGSEKFGIETAFPSVAESGFDYVIMNPPYTNVKIDGTLKSTWHSYSDIAIGKTGDTHLAFTEMLWRMPSGRGVSAAVLPMAVGTNTTAAYRKLRRELLNTTGIKEFLFFDREPQALFGEDIKTRNVIVFLKQNSANSIVKTSCMLKWTAEQRPSIFTRDRLVNVSLPECEAFVPKLGSNIEAFVYRCLKSPNIIKCASQHIPRVSRMSLDEAICTEDTIRSNTLLVSSTAYNFINSFFIEALPKNPSRTYSNSPLNSLYCSSEDEAYAAFALVSSRLCFWLWHVESDGFHLTGDFLKRLPIWAVWESLSLKQYLAEHGKQLWQVAKASKTGAINGGKQTYSFHCSYNHPLAIDAERIMLQYLGIDQQFSISLNSFVEKTVSIDGKKRSRHTSSELNLVV